MLPAFGFFTHCTEALLSGHMFQVPKETFSVNPERLPGGTFRAYRGEPIGLIGFRVYSGF